MDVLVVGGAGYIGGHVVLELLDAGITVTVFDNFTTGSMKNVPAEVHVVEGDILSDSDLQSLFCDRQFDALIHLAALKAAGESMDNPGIYAENNIIGTINLLNYMVKYKTPAMVFSSSAAVYGYPDYLPIDEKHSTQPVNFYGYTKLAIEELLQWYSKLKGIRFAALRYFNAAGYDTEGRIQETEHDVANLLPIVMETAIGKRDEVHIFGNDYETKDGTGVRDYIHVSDLADAHVKALSVLQDNKENLKLNLGTGMGYSVLEVLDQAEKVTGRPIKSVFGPRRPGDPDTLTAFSSKAEKLLGWKPDHSDLETILTSMWQLYRNLDVK